MHGFSQFMLNSGSVQGRQQQYQGLLLILWSEGNKGLCSEILPAKGPVRQVPMTPVTFSTHLFHSKGLIIIIIIIIFVFLPFLGPLLRHMEVPRLGVESELQLPAYTAPQQRRIRASSATYTTAHGNARSLTH